jgi:hypothetical protein
VLGSVLEELGVQLDSSAFAFEQESLLGGVDGEHAGAVAVVDTELQLVAFDHDEVSGGEAAAGQLELGPFEGAGCSHVLARAGVELVDVGAAVGDHHDVAGLLAGGPPVADEAGAGLLAGVGDVDSVVGEVEREGRVGAPVA